MSIEATGDTTRGLQTRDLTVRYGDVSALAGVDLSVPAGEVMSVLGPSGSGKSTLLRVVAGLEPSATGTVSWGDDDLTRMPAHLRRFGLMFQDHALFPHRNVLDNVGFGLRMQHRPRPEIHRRAHDALDRVGLGGFEHRRVHELSGGEQQRVALARAIAPEPRLLMLDEPLGSLDRALRDRLVVELRALFVDVGLTAVFVTHDHDEACAGAQPVLLMRGGRVEQVGRPEEVWRHPATESVARFLGFLNPATLGGRRVLTRPDGLLIRADGPIAGIVVARTFRRDHFLLAVTGTDGTRYEVAVTGAEVPIPGDHVRLAVDPAAALEFPALE
ncbi:MAG: ABC transporter ATP-binding protein [Acidimicrobiia bacterium]